MDHFRAGVLMLAVAGERDGKHFAARFAAFHDHARILHRQARADVAIDPFDFRFLVRKPALGHEIEDVVRPVLDRDVLKLRAFHRDQLDHSAVQRGGVKLRRRAAFHVGQLRAFIDDDERAFELTEILGVDPEIGLERMLHFHAWRHVDERSTAKNGAVERAEFVVADGNDFPEPVPENLRMMFQTIGAAHENDALLADRFLDVRINRLAIELRFDAGEEFALLFGNAEPLESALYIVRDVFPTAFRLGAAAQVVADIVETIASRSLLAQCVGKGLLRKVRRAFSRNSRTQSGSCFTSEM